MKRYKGFRCLDVFVGRHLWDLKFIDSKSVILIYEMLFYYLSCHITVAMQIKMNVQETKEIVSANWILML